MRVFLVSSLKHYVLRTQPAMVQGLAGGYGRVSEHCHQGMHVTMSLDTLQVTCPWSFSHVTSTGLE